MTAPVPIEQAERNVIDAALDWIYVEKMNCASALMALEQAVGDLVEARKRRRSEQAAQQ